MFNPFQQEQVPEYSETELIRKSLDGDLHSLETIVLHHQAWIYNIALRMVCVPEDAEDVTQEILIKILTKLSQYDPDKAAFRTWLYRIVVNHVLTMKNRKIEDLMSFHDNMHEAGNERSEEYPNFQEKAVLVEEMEIGCYLGSLLCFDRKERLVFILGAIFEVNSKVGGKIMELSDANFRKILSRSRKKLMNFMGNRCGLLNKENPCKCSKNIVAGINSGWLNPSSIVFHKGKNKTIREIVNKKINADMVLEYRDTVDLFRSHPFYTGFDFAQKLTHLVNDPEFKKAFSV